MNAAPARQRSSSQRPRAGRSHAASAVPATRLSSSIPLGKGSSEASRKARASSQTRQRATSVAKSTSKKSVSTSAGLPEKAHRVSPAASQETGGPAFSRFAATDPPRHRYSTGSRAGSSTGANVSNQFFSSSTSRLARGVTTAVAVVRLQRATRLFLMRRALQRIPTSPPRRNSCDKLPCRSHGETEESNRNLAGAIVTTASLLPSAPAAAATESRMLHRIKAELYRMERLSSFRAMIAKRTLVAALREWVLRRRAQKRCDGTSVGSAGSADLLTHDVLAHFLADAGGAVEEAAPTVQAMLRAHDSCRLVAKHRDGQQRRLAASAIQRAWRRSPRYGAYIHHLDDSHAREVLCRQESVERRDMLRRHFAFLVRCHQLLYNAPCMWEAGLAVRRLPLHTADGLFLSAQASPCAKGPMQLLAASNASPKTSSLNGETGVALRSSPPLSALPALLHSTGSPEGTGAVAAATVVGSSPCVRGGDAWWRDALQLDMEAELRRCQYRLFFSPEDFRLLEDGGGEEADAAATTFTVGPSPLSNTTAVSPVKNGADARTQSLLAATENDVPYAEAFASALTFLRRPPSVDPGMQLALRQVEEARSAPAQLMRILQTHGHLSPELVAPFTCYGLHYQLVARGEADQAVLAATAAMQMCEPRLVGVVANPAEELRHCLVGAAVRRLGGGEGGGLCDLPLPLEACRWRRDGHLFFTTATAAATAAESQDARKRAPAVMQRSGFANPATQALFDSGAAKQEDTDPLDAEKAATAWDHRLAAGIGELGAAWRQLLLSLPVAPPPLGTIAVDAHWTTSDKKLQRRGEEEKGNKEEGNKARALVPPCGQPGRRLVGLRSHLGPASSSASVLLRDFEPSAATPNNDSGRCEKGEHRNHAALGTECRVIAVRAAAPSKHNFSSSSFAKADRASFTVFRPEEWCDAVERLFIQERVRRLSMERNESEQRRSVGLLRRLASSADTTALEASA